MNNNEKNNTNTEKNNTHRGRLSIKELMYAIVVHYKEIIALVAIMIALALISMSIRDIAKQINIINESDYRAVRVTLYSDNKEVLEKYEGHYKCNSSQGKVYMEKRDGTGVAVICESGYIVVEYLDETRDLD